MRALVVCALLVAACKGKEPAVTAEACGYAVAHLAWPAQLRDQLAASCFETKWSAATVACMKAVTDPVTCKDKMTGAQQHGLAQLAHLVDKAKAEAAAQAEAEAKAGEAVEAAREAQAAIERLEQEATDLQKQLTEATDAIVGAQTEADRRAANAKLEALQRQKAELDAPITDAKANAARAGRLQGTTIDKECLDNPLATGCN